MSTPEQKYRDAQTALAAFQDETAVGPAAIDGTRDLKLARARLAVEQAAVDFVAASPELAQIRAFVIGELKAAGKAFAKFESDDPTPPTIPQAFEGAITSDALRAHAQARFEAATFADAQRIAQATAEQRLSAALWAAVLANRALGVARAAQRLPPPGLIGLPRGASYSALNPFELPRTAEACANAIRGVEAARTPQSEDLERARKAVAEIEERTGRELLARKDAERRAEEQERRAQALDRQENEARARRFRDERAADEKRAAALAAERDANRKALAGAGA